MNYFVLHISRHLVYRNPDVFSTRYKLFLIKLEYFRVSSHLLILVWIFIEFRIVSTYITEEIMERTRFFDSRNDTLYWWDRSNSHRNHHSVKNRQRRILWMIHDSVVFHRLDITSAFRNRFRDDMMTISSICFSNHINVWTTYLWHSFANQNFLVNFFDVSSSSLTVTSVSRPTNIYIYIYIEM